MKRKQIDFRIQEAGCLLYTADRNFGGERFTRLHDFFGSKPGLKDLVRRGAIMPMSLYQDDGYTVRVCLGGELTREEKSEWTSCVSWRLNLESGKMVVSGVLPDDDELSDFSPAEDGGEYELGCIVEVPAGEYQVTVRSYPPNDLAGGWLRIEKPDTFRIGFGKSDLVLKREEPIEYFRRTRPGEIAPEWIEEGYEDAEFLDFLIHLMPLEADLEEPEFEPDGCLVWQYRQPEICPVGIRLE